MDVGDRIWPEALAHKPDAVFMIGDNVYVDRKNGQIVSGDGDHIWNRYDETRTRLPIFFAETLTPIFATWDDHDFGANDTDRTFPYKQDSTDIFFGFFPQRKAAPGFERGPGVASIFTGFGLTWIFLDDRSFRSPNKSGSPDQTHLGLDQERWVSEHLASAEGPVALISGDQFFGGYHKMESFEGSHSENFKKLLAEWEKARAPIVFFSGDRHLTEIMKIPPNYLGYPTFEVTSSAIHAKVFPGTLAKDPNPRQWVGMDGINNYSIIETMRSEPNLLQLSVSAFTLNHKLLYQKTLTVKHP
jgi:phosphodiesterase/alkaline phosphatase D-like protein